MSSTVTAKMCLCYSVCIMIILCMTTSELHAQVGLGINPPTEVDVVLPYVDMVDLILIMTVNPGFGGQSFIPECLPKVTVQAVLQ